MFLNTLGLGRHQVEQWGKVSAESKGMYKSSDVRNEERIRNQNLRASENEAKKKK